MDIAFLKGSRVILRPVLEEDIQFFTKWVNDEEVRRYMTNTMPITPPEEGGWVASLEKKKPNHIVFTIVVEEKPIGNMGFHAINWISRVATTGAMIGEKDYWGKGYGSEAKMLLLGYAFSELNLRKVCSSVIAYNERSYRYSLKCGYKEEGRRKEQFFREGKYWDEIQLAVFRDEWLALHTAQLKD